MTILFLTFTLTGKYYHLHFWTVQLPVEAGARQSKIACYFQTKTRASSSRVDLLDCIHAITWQPDGMLGKSVGFTLRVCLVNGPQKAFAKGGLKLGGGLDKPSAYYIQRTAIGYFSGFLLEATTLDTRCAKAFY